jgi:glycosyltransferase involved in cell wall biosynthesis
MANESTISTQKRMRVAFVPPRFGASLGGGAEALSADLARLLAGIPGFEVEIWTTCARDHRTWENHYPAGASVEEGLTVRRFPVDERDLEKFISAEIKLAEGRQLTIEEQIGWLENSVNSTELYSYIAEYGTGFDWIIFAPYLFATTFWGAQIYPERSAIIPCLHDEAYAYLPVFAQLFNAAPEQELAEKLYPKAGMATKGFEVGMSFLPRLQMPRDQTLPGGLVRGGYLLYSGRKERGKNLDLAIDYYQALGRSGLKLAVIGSGRIDFIKELPAGVVDLGFVDDETKGLVMANSLALVQPSTNESFSIVLMESWLMGRPAIVNGHCAVTRRHVEDSGGGLYFRDAEEFADVVSALKKDSGLADRLGSWGRRYVEHRYQPNAVLGRLLRALSDEADSLELGSCESSITVRQQVSPSGTF